MAEPYLVDNRQKMLTAGSSSPPLRPESPLEEEAEGDITVMDEESLSAMRRLQLTSSSSFSSSFGSKSRPKKPTRRPLSSYKVLELIFAFLFHCSFLFFLYLRIMKRTMTLMASNVSRILRQSPCEHLRTRLYARATPRLMTAGVTFKTLLFKALLFLFLPRLLIDQ